MNASMNKANESCERSKEALDWVMGEIQGTARSDFERHLQECFRCRSDVEFYREFGSALREAMADHPCRDLEPEIRFKIAAIRRSESRWRRGVVWSAGVVAALLAVMGVWWFIAMVRGGGKEAVEVMAVNRQVARQEAVRWLCSIQQTDGGWYRAGDGAKEYGEALTGLAILAALELDGDPRLEEAASRAVTWLANRVDVEGRIGDPAFSGQPYNQGIGSLALLRWCERHPFSPHRRVALRAAKWITTVQSPLGGWGYADQPDEPNVSVTVWQLQALHVAKRIMEREPMWEQALAKGLRWIRSTRNSEGYYGYRRVDDFPAGTEALTAMSLYCEMTLDAESLKRPETRFSLERLKEGVEASEREPSYYAAFFAIRSLRKAGAREVESTLDRLEKRILALQETKGLDRGSWPATDGYARLGGRIYSTAMAAMAVAGR